MNIEHKFLKKGDIVKVFDYGNDIYDTTVTILSNDVIHDILTYKLSNDDIYDFSGQGYFTQN